MVATTHAVPFSPSVETPEADEAETVRALNEQFHIIQETTAKDYGIAVRGVHAKGHAIVKGSIEILSGLAPDLAQGLFATPGRHDAVLRFSTNPGDILDDSVSAPRGLAVKILDVAGDRLPGAEGATTQDFVMANGPAFSAPDPKKFLSSLKLLTKTTDVGEGLKKMLSATLQTVEAGLETVGIKSPTVQSLGGAPNTHPLGETYYSQVAFRHGDRIAKLAIAPVSPSLTALTGEKVAAAGRPDALREDIAEVLVEQDGVWELRVQLCTDLDAMPIEDASAVWDEDESPYVAVARITVPAQLAWERGVSDRREQTLSFSPWHGLDAHRPLGGINRVRKPTYEASSAFRGQYNGCPIHEPRTLSDITDSGPTV